MDFLDPKKKRAHELRLIVGYVLVAIVIFLATVIVVYGASGYGIDTKTGEIVQNGLLFADSKPNGAEIHLNGKDRNTTTAARLNLPAGTYNLKLTKDGYRDWSRTFVLNEQSIARYVYPFLFPQKPVTHNIKPYDSQPGLVTQSPNLKWLMVLNNAASDKTAVFDEYDTTTLDDATPTSQSVSLPAQLLTNYSANSTIKEVEWSTDNNNILLLHTYADGSEYIIFNRDKPEESFNVNRLFSVTPTSVSLYDKKTDQLYIMTESGGSLQLGKVESKQLEAPIIKSVLAYKPYGKDLVAYITPNAKLPGIVDAKIWEKAKTYKLNEITASNQYMIDLAEFQNHFYYADGSDAMGRINIYKDPLDSVRSPSNGRALPLMSMRIAGVTKLKFSANTRFIGAENGQNFAVYDLETKTGYEYQVANTLSANMSWMDGHRFIGQADGAVLVMDYDGNNKQTLTASSLSQGGFFDRNYNHMLVLNSAEGTSAVLQDVDMRSGSDLHKNKQ